MAKKRLISDPLLRIGAIIAATALFGAYAKAEFTHAGMWLPSVPDHIGIWDATDTPLPEDTLQQLGSPQALGREYNNAFNEPVRVSVISAGNFEAYHDPTVCITGGGFTLTAKRVFPIDGPGSGLVRAMVFKRTDPQYGVVRIVMYYWQQNRDGTTATDAVMGNYRDVLSRFRTGFGAVVQRHQTVLVRVYAPMGPEDRDGIQTQRNVEEISRAVYRAMKKSGAAEE